MQGLPITAKIKDWVKYANISLYFLKKYNYLVISFSIKMLLPFLITILPTIVQSPPLWPPLFHFFPLSLPTFKSLSYFYSPEFFYSNFKSQRQFFNQKHDTYNRLAVHFYIIGILLLFKQYSLFFWFNKKLTLSFYSSSLFYNYLYLFFIFITFLSWLIFYLE